MLLVLICALLSYTVARFGFDLSVVDTAFATMGGTVLLTFIIVAIRGK
jgi:hypothetical protein